MPAFSGNASPDSSGSLAAAFPALRRLAHRRPRAEESCELCAERLGERHPHLLALRDRRILCACAACALLFSEVREHRRLRAIPRDVEALADFAISDAEWQSLGVPIQLAFFFHHSGAGHVVALYPSPAGVTENSLPLEEFAAIAARSPRLQALEPDVEALLVNRLNSPADHFLAPIDRCYELAGLLRTHWRGFTGGDGLWTRVETFFDALRAECAPNHAQS